MLIVGWRKTQVGGFLAVSCLERLEVRATALSPLSSLKYNYLMTTAVQSVPPPTGDSITPANRARLQRLNQPTHRVGHKEGPLLPFDHLARVVGHPPPFSKEEKEEFKLLLVWRFNEKQRSRPSVIRLEQLERLRKEREEEREARYGKAKKSSGLRKQYSGGRQQGNGPALQESSDGSSDSDEERPARGNGRGGPGDVRGGYDPVPGGVRHSAVRGTVNAGQDVQERY